MKDSLRLIIVLSVICAAAGLLLAAVNKITTAPIAAAGRTEKLNAMQEVLPEFDNEPDTDCVTIPDSDAVFFVARKDGTFSGAAFEVSSDKGYGGKIVLMVGVNAYDEVQGIEILKQLETPGLGAKIESLEFKNGFPGRSLSQTKWAVQKDGGDIDQITAATISSRAVTEAIREGIAVYLANKSRIQGKSSQPAEAVDIQLDDDTMDSIDQLDRTKDTL